MLPRDDFLCITRVPKPGLPLAQNGPAPSSPRGAGPTLCSWLFCDKRATHDDLCEAHWDKTADIRAEYDALRAEYEEGW